MSGYDSLSVGQKKLVCDTARTVVLECRGTSYSHGAAVLRRTQGMPAYMVEVVQALSESVRDGVITLESLSTPVDPPSRDQVIEECVRRVHESETKKEKRR